MDFSHPATLLVPVGIAALVGWRLFRRVRRMVGRQRLSKVRPWVTLCVFPLLTALLLLASVSRPSASLALLAGIVMGAALGWQGLRLTKFEPTPSGLFYTPSAPLGIALSCLLVARIGYRALQLGFAPGEPPGSSTAFVGSPLTLVIFGTLAGYSTAYAVGLLRWRRRVEAGGDRAAAGIDR